MKQLLHDEDDKLTEMVIGKKVRCIIAQCDQCN